MAGDITMPYKDKAKQKEALARSSRKHCQLPLA